MTGFTVENGVQPKRVDKVVLFPFDKFSIPLQDGLRLHMVTGRKYSGNPIVKRGSLREPDSMNVSYYGTVIQINRKLHMWYIGAGKDLPWNLPPHFRGWTYGRVCYATSQDGFHWEKPALGLVEYKGSKMNNLVDLPRNDLLCVLVLYDSEDPARPFKMVFESFGYQQRMGVAYSHDGICWKESKKNPVFRHVFEPSGLIKFNGCYYVNGQSEGTRRMQTFMSYDFENWTDASITSFRRDFSEYQPWSPSIHNQGEQIHEGAALWNRGNVIIGFYGQWHGSENNDRRFVNIDIGLVVSCDATHFYEPLRNFKVVPGYEEIDGAGSALMQGQGFENVGDQTLFWYDAWRDGEIRVAIWPRDRLGYYSVSDEPFVPSWVKPHFISCPIQLNSLGKGVFASVDGLSEKSFITVEILDRKFRRLEDYSEENSIPITKDGFQQPVVWRNKKTLDKIGQSFRIRVNYGGIRPEDIRVYAIYLV